MSIRMNYSDENTVGGSRTSAHPVQILIYNDQKECFELNSNELEMILNSPDVRDANIAVVSIAGAFRTGKSFMLSFFLRYLNEVYIYNNYGDWLGNEQTRLSGFSWRNGSEPHTAGIWIWSKIYTKILPTGEKIGVMLMDTQGTFDRNSTMKDNVTIFSLSTMLSSMQIYNLFNNIKEHDLHHLQLFTDYGKMAKKQTDETAFQMMLFLIRDWSCKYEAPFGFAGGRKILDRTFEVNKKQPVELADVRIHIKSCYEQLDCFLIPSPGEEATTSGNFAGQLKDIKTDFKDMLKEFVPAILAPENVWTKKIGGVKVQGKTFLTYIRAYWDIFSKGSLPTPQTILGAMSEANNFTAKQEATEFYQREMGSATGKDTACLEFAKLVEIHNVIVTKSLALFRSKAIMGDDRLKTNHYNQLNSSLQNYFMLYLAQNDAKKSKDLSKTINNLSHEIANYRSTNRDQMAMMENLKAQIMEYREMYNTEKKHRETQIKEYKELYEIEKQQREAQINGYRELLNADKRFQDQRAENRRYEQEHFNATHVKDCKRCDKNEKKLIVAELNAYKALNEAEKQRLKTEIDELKAKNDKENLALQNKIASVEGQQVTLKDESESMNIFKQVGNVFTAAKKNFFSLFK